MASDITRIQVKQDLQATNSVVIVVVRGPAEDNGGGGEASVSETGVNARELSINWEKGGAAWVGGNNGMGSGETVPGLLEGIDVRALTQLGQLGTMER